MWMLNPIVSILHNLKQNTYHPIYFYEAPLPGDSDIIRHKSKAHHTEGFCTREEAIRHIEENTNKFDGLRKCLDKDFPWDGEDIPAMVVFFQEIDSKLQPIF